MESTGTPKIIEATELEQKEFDALFSEVKKRIYLENEDEKPLKEQILSMVPHLLQLSQKKIDIDPLRKTYVDALVELVDALKKARQQQAQETATAFAHRQIGDGKYSNAERIRYVRFTLPNLLTYRYQVH